MRAAEGTRLARAMAGLLEREAAALREGRFEQIAPLLAEKERLAQRLAAAPAEARPGGDEAERLRTAAARNGQLLQALLEGLRDGITRLGALAAPPATLQTYDGAGRRTTLAPQTPAAERRA
jgi:flagellar biosynthesis/type III secretory pathway chaperone